MPYLPSLNAFLHSASQLLAAYPTARITTKYSLPKLSSSTATKDAPPAADTAETNPSAPTKTLAATLTAKIYHPQTGICLKYSTDKAQEVGRLFTSLGKLARGEAIDLPSATAAGSGLAAAGAEDGADKMDVDSGGVSAVKVEDGVVTGKPVAGQSQQGQQGQQQQGGGGGGKGKKKKGKR